MPYLAAVNISYPLSQSLGHAQLPLLPSVAVSFVDCISLSPQASTHASLFYRAKQTVCYQHAASQWVTFLGNGVQEILLPAYSLAESLLLTGFMFLKFKAKHNVNASII